MEEFMLALISALGGAVLGFCIFALNVDPHNFYQENVCHYQQGTWHDGDNLCIKDGRVLNIKNK